MNYTPKKPAATYRRGQYVDIKYQRNNHAPGGFNRITIVPLNSMMDRNVHNRNAFHYSCWGAKTEVVRGNGLKKKKYGFSLIGNDGSQHRFPKSVYVTKVYIPPVIPNGIYVLGWMWYGGTGSKVKTNAQQKPSSYGYFGDYYSCSFIRIEGGVPLQNSYTPKFDNDMSKFSKEGCMAANDAPGVCKREPCRVKAKFQKPREFKNGKPQRLTPKNFGYAGSSGSGGSNGGGGGNTLQARKSCGCLGKGKACTQAIAKATKWICRAHQNPSGQPQNCKSTCCKFCRSASQQQKKTFCSSANVKKLCK